MRVPVTHPSAVTVGVENRVSPSSFPPRLQCSADNNEQTSASFAFQDGISMEIFLNVSSWCPGYGFQFCF